MYIRSYVRRGHTYYEVRDSIRDGVAVRTRRIVQLGRFSTIREAHDHFLAEYFKAKRSGKHAPFSPAQAKAWKRITRLSGCLNRQQDTPRELDMRYVREYQRWEQHERRQEAARKRREQSMIRNPWRILGVSKRATDEQIKAAYRRKAQECHPDRGGSDEAMARINEAYERLRPA
jgi:hypothetical protein